MIRALHKTHLDEFIKIRKESLRLSPRSFSSEPNRSIDREQTLKDLAAKNEENFILAYFGEKKLVGMVGFIRRSKKKVRHKSFLWGVFVYPEFRGQGIGKQLMEETILRASRLEGLEKINLSVTDASAKALALYRQLGFVEYGRERKSMYWEGEWMDEIFMEKRLLPG